MDRPAEFVGQGMFGGGRPGDTDAAGRKRAVEEAMKQAARRDQGGEREIEARYNEELGEIELFEFREVVEEAADETIQIALGEAREYDPEAQIGDEIGVKLDTTGFGRILAQTAKQVIIQRVRDAERDIDRLRAFTQQLIDREALS